MTSATVANRSPRGLLKALFGVALLALMLFPLYWMVNASFQPSGALLKPNPSFFPSEPSFDGYVETFATQGSRLWTSIVVSFGTVIVTLLVATPAAYALAKLRLPGKRSWILLVITVQMIPGIVMANALFIMFTRLGWTDTYWGLMLADATTSIPLAILIMRAFMQDISPDFIEAAKLDGATDLRIFWSVILPISRNAVITAALFAFLHGWSDFLFAVTLTSGSGIMPVTVGLYRFIGAQTADWNGVMATATVASVPAIVLLVLAQRYISAGITGGGLKG